MRSMYHASHQLRETSTTTMHRRECQPECQGRVEAKSKQMRSKMRCLLRRGLPTGSPTPITIPSSTADPSPVRPALLHPPTRNSRKYRVEDEQM